MQHFRGRAYYDQTGGEEEEVPAGLHFICCFSVPYAIMIKRPLLVQLRCDYPDTCKCSNTVPQTFWHAKFDLYIVIGFLSNLYVTNLPFERDHHKLNVTFIFSCWGSVFCTIFNCSLFSFSLNVPPSVCWVCFSSSPPCCHTILRGYCT